MSPLPAHMRDRWSKRRELEADRGMVYWHVLMHAYPQACDAATDAHDVLARFPGFHLTPLKWLHMTMLVAGSTGEISRAQMAIMVSEARQSLSQVAPIPVTLGKILYHPEAIMLRLQPAEALWPILEAAQAATQTATGRAGSIDGSPSPWVPHMTVSYSTAEQPAEPIISALGRAVRERHIYIDALSLVIQWGPEKLWNWEPVGTARLQGRAVAEAGSPEEAG